MVLQNYFNHGQGGVFFFGMVNGAGSTITGLFEGNKATEGGVLVADTVDCDGELTLTGTYTNNAAEDFYGHCGSRGGAITVRRVDGGTTVTIDGTFENNIGGVFGGVLRNDRILNNARINLYGDFTDNTAEDGNIANMRVLASGSIFHFAPSNIDTISADDIQFSSDACTDTSTKENVITCEN
ncbi:hypothetical protein SARC_06784 [Sphaeroforma arctica JP610]|uniref:Right handed beta helix domain-containing protein n=1 Tax=Sphaeroforma arctica JP610 TaxID=667725 RepID=A0A0L0FY31_9EUKA|nr:hypothetical protein SARC_06784 [Sphaeroforma arctica JP610]KNC80868.1 hypothetical protein SARC_06784 [Sphaeroforma arctica JP610]|eukprot:XP_014154770.1 hypothetical protein SARC_06784 [Sphaeroforma arctica JP610]